MASLEAEAFLLGHWRNFAELEENLNLDELRYIVDAARDRQHADRRFMAALKGIDLDEDEKQRAQDKVDEIKRRVHARLHNTSEAKLELDELAFDFEIEDE